MFEVWRKKMLKDKKKLILKLKIAKKFERNQKVKGKHLKFRGVTVDFLLPKKKLGHKRLKLRGISRRCLLGLRKRI